MDRSPQAAADEKGMRTEAFRSFAPPELKTMELQTGHNMVDQWRGHFVNKAMPFTVPRLISGPDFFPGERERSDPEDGLPCTPTMSPTASRNIFTQE